MSVYQHDASLDALPIPLLVGTHENLLKEIRPLVSDEVYAEAESAMDTFYEIDGSGQKLQELLQCFKSALPANASWLRPIWDDRYLSSRGSTPLDLDYGFELVASRWTRDALPLFICALCESIQAIREETLQPQATYSGYLSMDTLRHMIFTRIPGALRDSWYYPPLSEPPTIAVVCRGHWFILTMQDENGEMVHPGAVKAALLEIRERAKELPHAEGASIFTSVPRDDAFALRNELSKNLMNRISLESIERSLFALCLDEPVPQVAKSGRDIICGDPAQRFVDKSLQVISDGSRISVHLEHSGCDAAIWLYVLNYTDELLLNSPRLLHTEEAAHVRRLEWNIGSELKAHLKKAGDDYLARANTVQFSRRHLSGVSKSAIKAKKYSPDAFVQMIYQAAYYQLTGEFRSVYEAVSSRTYYQGRTESVRPVSEESVAFVKAFAAGETGAPLEDKFREAVQRHMYRLARAQKGLSSNRHMVGLESIYYMYKGRPELKGMKLPAIFETEGYKILTHDSLSTSSSTIDCIDFFAYAPVVQDGLGIGYGIKDDALHLMVSSYPDTGISPDAFIDAVEEAGKKLLGILKGS